MSAGAQSAEKTMTGDPTSHGITFWQAGTRRAAVALVSKLVQLRAV